MSSTIDRGVREKSPSPELVLKKFAAITQKTAIRAHQIMASETGGVPILDDLPEVIYKPRAKRIDNGAGATFNEGLHELKECTSHVVGDEAQKDLDKGHDGIETGFGIYGSGPYHVWVVRDVVEGTRFVAHCRPNAVSITAVSTVGGLMETPIRPDDRKRVAHMRKLFVPRGVNPNSISLDQPPEDNIMAVARAFDWKPEDVQVITMKRNCNAGIIKAARDLGAEVIEVSDGDLAWSMRTSLWTPRSGEKPMCFITRGGFEEGEIGLVVAKLVGAPAQGRIVYERADIEIVDSTPIFTEAEAVPGSPAETFVTLTAITPNEHFGLRGVTPEGNGYRVHSMHVTNIGVSTSEQIYQ